MTVIRPALEGLVGDALVCDDRDATNLPVEVPIYEMYQHLSAAIETAMLQASVS